MSNIGDLVSSVGIQDVVDGGWKVAGAHVFPIKWPIFLRFWIQGGMFATEPSSSVVQQPDIIALSGQNEGMSYLWQVIDILHHVHFEGMD